MMDHNYDSNAGKKWLWLVAIVVGAFFLIPYIFDGGASIPQSQSLVSTDLQGPGEDYSRGYDTDWDEYDRLQSEEEADEVPIIEEDTNECGSTEYGFADYDGTNKEGKFCSDYYEADLECVANPPKNYDGTTYGSYSNPQIKCCEDDKTCYW